jgi:ornithine cyclodeaminase/alanine dehydrogenase-like protein (mu-crystallin family)
VKEAVTSDLRPRIPYLGAEELQRSLPLLDAVDALERAFATTPLPTTPVRNHFEADGGELLLMPAWGEQGLGVKLITLEPRNAAYGLPLIHGVFVLFARDTKAPIATMDGAALTSLRTAAVSALGARHLARQDARSLLIFGAGTQARAHLDAMLEIRDLTSLVVVDPATERAEALAALGAERGLSARVGSPEDVRDADLICCCTTSREPVVRGALLSPGTHIAAMGAYRPDMREVDAETLHRSSVLVETRDAALAEAGDLLIPIAAGEWSADLIAGELADAVRGTASRADAEQITILKTVGLASEDLVVAQAAVQNFRLHDLP